MCDRLNIEGVGILGRIADPRSVSHLPVITGSDTRKGLHMSLAGPSVSPLLRCSVEPGVFPHERLIRFVDANKVEQTALVGAHLVRSGGLQDCVMVVLRAERGDRVLVTLPTSDADRVWVDRGLLSSARAEQAHSPAITGKERA